MLKKNRFEKKKSASIFCDKKIFGFFFWTKRKKKMLPSPSKEQQKILDLVSKNKNVIVEALAGAGKTTLLLHLIMSNSKKGFMVCYNRALVDETNLLIGKLEQEHKINLRSRVMVVTYHSLLSLMCNKVIDDDLLFSIAMFQTDFSLKRTKNWKFSDFDFFIIDECQDMRDGYFRLVIKMLIECCVFPQNTQIVVVGDKIQLIYDFYAINRADSRFLTSMDQLLKNVSKNQWERATLTTSYRSTEPMAYFIDSIFKGRITIPKPATLEERKQEKPVIIYVLDLYKDCAQVIASCFDSTFQKKPQPKKIRTAFVLCPSLNDRSPAVGIVDLLVEKKYNVHVARSGNLSDGGSSHLNQSITQNKILFKTKHAAKGLQANQVHVLCFNNIFDYKQNPLPNSDYVAFTRADEELHIHVDYRNVSEMDIKNYIDKNPQLKQRHVRIIVLKDLKPGTTVEEDDQKNDKRQETKPKKNTTFTANTLFDFLDVCHLKVLLTSISIREIQSPLTLIMEEELQLEYDVKDEYNIDEQNNNDDNNNHFLTKVEQAELRMKQMERYFHEMNVTYDRGETYINITNICGIAIKMALEFALTKCIPVLIHKMYSNCLIKSQYDLKYAALCKQLEHVIQELRAFTPPQSTKIDPIVNTLRKFKIFAKMGTLLDAYSGYTEKLFSLKDYDFIFKPSIFERFRALFKCLSLILNNHNIKQDELLWYRDETKQFETDNKEEDGKKCEAPITINVKPTLISKCGSLLIDIIHSTCISHEHHLSALIAAQILGNAKTSVYVVNIGDGSIECSQLNHDQKSMDFIEKAIKFKLAKEEDLNDANFIESYQKLVCESLQKRQQEQQPPVHKKIKL